MKRLLVILTVLFLAGCVADDKIMHIGAGAFVAATAKAAGLSNRQACGAAIAAGVAKEVYDSRYPDHHTVDIMDAVATAAVCIPLLMNKRNNTRVTYTGPIKPVVPKIPKSKIVGVF
jgi:hypothetical protein